MTTTIVAVVPRESVPVCVSPGDHLDEVSHERRYRTLHDSRVSTDDVLVVHFGLVELLDN